MKNKILPLLMSIIISSIACADTKIASSFHYSLQFSELTDDLVHYVNFVQEPPLGGIKSILAAMNKAGVKDIMISGQPVMKRWDVEDTIRPIYYLDNDSKVYAYSLTDIMVAQAILSLKKEDQLRFHPFIVGFDPTDKNAINQIELLIKWYPHFWQGIGQINTRHGALSHLTEGSQAKANNKALSLIYDLAAKHHFPVIIQSDISTSWTSMSSSSAKKPLYLNEITSAVKRHPNTVFIWAHAGLNRDIKIINLPKILNHILKKYKNLYIDISGLAYPYIFEKGMPAPLWVNLINQYPNRFIFGTDSFQQFDQYPEKVRQYESLFRKLNRDVAEKVFKTNFINLLPAKQ